MDAFLFIYFSGYEKNWTDITLCLSSAANPLLMARITQLLIESGVCLLLLLVLLTL